MRSSREPLSVGAGNGTWIGNPGCVVGLMCGHCGLKTDRQMRGRECLRQGCHRGGQAEVSVARTGYAPLQVPVAALHWSPVGGEYRRPCAGGKKERWPIGCGGHLGDSSCLDPRTDMFSPILCVEKGQCKLQSGHMN